ncbi:MAG: GAF domain-containing protein, partial [Chloroflexota bacterium]
MYPTFSPGLMLEIGQAILAADGAESTVAIVLDAARQLTGADTVGLVLLDQCGQWLTCANATGVEANRLIAMAPYPRTDGAAGRAITTGQPVWSNDILHDARFTISAQLQRDFVRVRDQSVLAAPLTVRGQIAGAIVAFGFGTDGISLDRIELLRALTSLAGVALENARLKEDLRAQANRSQVVAEMARIVSSSLNLPELLAALLAEIQRIVPCVLGSFAFYDRASHSISYHAMVAPGRPSTRPVATESADGTVAWSVIQARKPQIIDDYQQSPIAHHAARLRQGFRSSVCVPIIREAECLGVLNLVSNEAYAFTSEHVAYLEELTPHLAVAIDKTRLFEQATERARRMSRLAELSRLVSARLDLEQVQRFVTRAGSDLLGADVTRLFLTDPDGQTLSLVSATGKNPG